MIFKLLANLSKLDKVQKLQGIQRYRFLLLIRKNKLTVSTIVFLEIDEKMIIARHTVIDIKNKVYFISN